MTMILVGHIVETDFFYQTRLKNCWKNAKYRVTGCRHDPLCQSGIMLQVNPVTPGAPQIESWLDSGWFKPASTVLPHPV
jgi:hypothetical protein